MAVNRHAMLVRRAINEIWNQQQLDVADELFAANYVNHGGLIPDLVGGPETVKFSVALYRTAFPDLHVTVDELSTEGDICLLRWTAHGRSSSGQGGTLTGITRSRLIGGQIAESWTCWDSNRVLRQIGVLPPGPVD